MRTYQTSLDGPISLILSADARLSHPNYLSDTTWELSPVISEPPALALETTFGLRARTMRIFPRFVTPEGAITNPQEFYNPPVVEVALPNYVRLHFAPLLGLETTAEYWIPDSGTAAGRLRFFNQSVLMQHLDLELAALLSPLGEGQGIAAETVRRQVYLQGSTSGLTVAGVLDQNPQPGRGPYPSLMVPLEFYPGGEKTLTWAFAALPDAAAALQHASRTLQVPWEAETARLELLNTAQTVQIFTGNPDWDIVLAQAQTHALRLFLPGSAHLPQPSFVSSRQPEHGFSLRGDGSDYTHLWNGQTALEAWYLATLLPGAPELAEGVLRNFLAVQDENGFISGKPGLAGQRARYTAQPILAELAARIDACRTDHTWLEDVVPALVRHLHYWFSPAQDRDGDGFPEWTNPVQTGLPDVPLYDRWHPTAQAVPIETLESPGLGALLFRECRSLAVLARRIQHTEEAEWLESRAAALQEDIEATWDERARTYRYRDAQTHTNPSGQTLVAITQPGTIPLVRSFRHPQRLSLRLKVAEQSTVMVRFFLRGTNPEGEPVEEEINARQFTWMHGDGRFATQTLFGTLKEVEVRGLAPGEAGWLGTADYSQEDISQLLPLWAGIPSARRAQALIDRTILADFRQEYGMPVCPSEDCPPEPASLSGVSMLWNQFIGEGLLAYGRRAEAADLVTRLLNAAAEALCEGHAFRSHIHARSGQPFGEYNPVSGLAPVSLFLQAAGLHQIGTNCVILSDFNVFPFPITVQYRGMQVILRRNETIVSFSNGQTVTIDQPGFHRVSLAKPV